jgi:hypothetical protein
MSEENKTSNKLAEILARKKAMQANQQGKFNPSSGKQGKVSKGAGGATVVRRSGRGG